MPLYSSRDTKHAAVVSTVRLPPPVVQHTVPVCAAEDAARFGIWIACVAPLRTGTLTREFCTAAPAPVPPVWNIKSPDVPLPVLRLPLIVQFAPAMLLPVADCT